MNHRTFFILTISSLIILPAVTNAAEFELFQDSIPFLGDAADLNMENYVNALYTAAISIAAILVVIKLILAGVKYMFSEIVTDKEDAKSDIKGALFGLIIVLGAVTILNTINPNLTKLDFLERASRIQVDTTSNLTSGNTSQSNSSNWPVTVGTNIEAVRDAKAACDAQGGTFRTTGGRDKRKAYCD